MISIEVIVDENKIRQLIPECIELSKTEKLSLPFQYLHMPFHWCKTFKTVPGEQFSVKRGRNFLGEQSILEKTFFVTVRDDDVLCGVLPLVEFRVKAPRSNETIQVISTAGDFVLHPFQDFILRNKFRTQVISEILNTIAKITNSYNSIFWISYLPEESENISELRSNCSLLVNNSINCIEAVSTQRGGIWPWTIDGIFRALKRIDEISKNIEEDIDGLQSLLTQLSNCTAQSLILPFTRMTLLKSVNKILYQLSTNEEYSNPVDTIRTFLNDSPILFPYIELPDNKDEYLSSLSYHTRRYFRRYMKKYFESGGEFEVITPNKINDIDIEDYIQLHLLRWGKESASMCGESPGYHKNIAHAMAKEGMFKLFFAKYQGKRIAVHSCFDIESRREGYITGIDPNYSDLRIGRLLYIQTIFDAIDSGFKRYELGAVGTDYKMSFTSAASTAHNFFFFNKKMNNIFDKIFTGLESMKILHEYH